MHLTSAFALSRKWYPLKVALTIFGVILVSIVEVLTIDALYIHF